MPSDAGFDFTMTCALAVQIEIPNDGWFALQRSTRCLSIEVLMWRTSFLEK